MKKKIFDEENTFKDLNISENKIVPKKKIFFNENHVCLILCYLIFTLINAIILMVNFLNKKQIIINPKEKGNKTNKATNNDYPIKKDIRYHIFTEKYRPYFKEINKKRIFDTRFPLKKEINCESHFTENELIAFLSFLRNDTIFFETGSGCSSIIAKYYAKKTYAVEGCKKWYEKGIENGLKDNLIFHDLKPDNPDWSYPGKASTIEDWKKYFQSYNKSFNADIILIDGRFKAATALDIFGKIRDDTIVFIHEYQFRPIYFIMEQYYQYIYHWGFLFAFIKKKGIKSIPLEVQKKYWDNIY